MLFARHPLVLGVLIALAAGCSSDGGRTGGQKMVDGFVRTQNRLEQAQQLVDKSLTSMDQLGYTANLNSNTFSNYKKAVADLEKAGKEAADRAKWMQTNKAEYVSKWQKEMEKVTDPTIKASLEARKQAIQTNFDTIRATADEVRAAYDPFLANHKQIVQALSIDLSPAALPGLKPAMSKAHADGKTLKAKLAALQKQLDNVSRGMPPAGA